MPLAAQISQDDFPVVFSFGAFKEVEAEWFALTVGIDSYDLVQDGPHDFTFLFDLEVVGPR